MSGLFTELQYFNLGSQVNVYGLTDIINKNCSRTILIATLKGKIFSVEIRKSKLLLKEIQFTYIPGEAQLISIDAFNKISTTGIVIGITFVKDEGEKLSHYLNIYSDWDSSTNSELDRIAQCCQNIELPYVPLQLYHTRLKTDETTKTVLLLSSIHRSIHLYVEDSNNHQYVEKDIQTVFPEFCALSGSVTQMKCESFGNYSKRLSVYGCQNGIVSISLVDTTLPTVIKSWSVQLDGPITCLNLFCDTTHQDFSVINITDELSYPEINLLVTTAMEIAIVFRNVITSGFEDSYSLQLSGQHDSILCGFVTDIDFDGQNEILLGTYGQELLAFKFRCTPSQHSGGSTNKLSPAGKHTSSSLIQHSGESFVKINYYLKWQRSFPDPIMNINYLDLTEDGLNELILLSLHGVHILQHDLKEATRICMERLQLTANTDHLRNELLKALENNKSSQQ